MLIIIAKVIVTPIALACQWLCLIMAGLMFDSRFLEVDFMKIVWSKKTR